MPKERVWVLGAGGPAGYNVAAAAAIAGWRVIGVDSNPAHLVWPQKVCNSTKVHRQVPAEAVRERELVLPQPEKLVLRCSEDEDVRYHGPGASVISQSQDKEWTANRWARDGLLRHAPVRIVDPHQDWLHIAADRFGLPFWMRARRGAGGIGALLVEDLRAAHHWIRLHQIRGAGHDFIAQEYLPGRDFCWTAVYHEGERMASFSRERLEWLYPFLTPTGRTCTPTRSAVVIDAGVTDLGDHAVRAIDPSPHGVYCVDMREDREAYLQPTEVNAGRWATTSPLYRHLGPNLVDLQICLAHGLSVSPPGDDPYPADTELMRHIDMPLSIVDSDGLRWP